MERNRAVPAFWRVLDELYAAVEHEAGGFVGGGFAKGFFKVFAGEVPDALLVQVKAFGVGVTVGR